MKRRDWFWLLMAVAGGFKRYEVVVCLLLVWILCELLDIIVTDWKAGRFTK